jgi:hypothetical protein
MALVVRTSADTVSLPDHGFIGEEGGEPGVNRPLSGLSPSPSFPPHPSRPALRILVQITRQIRRLDISHNLLGTDGTLTLLQGLSALRGRYSTPALPGSSSPSDSGIWGLRELNFALNGLGDAAMEGVLGYAKKDVLLRRVFLQGNEIQVGTRGGVADAAGEQCGWDDPHAQRDANPAALAESQSPYKRIAGQVV